MQSKDQDYYDVLGVSRGASERWEENWFILCSLSESWTPER